MKYRSSISMHEKSISKENFLSSREKRFNANEIRVVHELIRGMFYDCNFID